MSQSITLDCRGLNCPQPVLMTKDALGQMTAGEIEITVDNEASRSNVERFAKSQGCSSTVVEKEGLYRITISKSGDSKPAIDAADASQYVCEPVRQELVYVVPSDTMGQGNDELGRVLMRAYIKTMKDVSPLPAKILFFNTGVMITANESDLVEPLKNLAAKGVEILSCGTCLDFLGLKDKLLVGKTTNMYEIMQSMASASQVVSPY
ncbi:MAG: sulfurtransferase-like selenium metabolism protein YedF [Pseudomonadota bacterium]